MFIFHWDFSDEVKINSKRTPYRLQYTICKFQLPTVKGQFKFRMSMSNTSIYFLSVYSNSIKNILQEPLIILTWFIGTLIGRYENWKHQTIFIPKGEDLSDRTKVILRLKPNHYKIPITWPSWFLPTETSSHSITCSLRNHIHLT